MLSVHLCVCVFFFGYSFSELGLISTNSFKLILNFRVHFRKMNKFWLVLQEKQMWYNRQCIDETLDWMWSIRVYYCLSAKRSVRLFNSTIERIGANSTFWYCIVHEKNKLIEKNYVISTKKKSFPIHFTRRAMCQTAILTTLKICFALLIKLMKFACFGKLESIHLKNKMILMNLDFCRPIVFVYFVVQCSSIGFVIFDGQSKQKSLINIVTRS